MSENLWDEHKLYYMSEWGVPINNLIMQHNQ